MKTELFVCDRCGQKKRLARSQQHWCEFCRSKKETEMRPVRVKPFSIGSAPVPR